MRLLDIVIDAYQGLLECNLTTSQYDFSKNVLERSPGYLSFLKCRDTEPNVGVILTALANIQKQTELFQNRIRNSIIDDVVFEYYNIKALAAKRIYEKMDTDLRKYYAP